MEKLIVYSSSEDEEYDSCTDLFLRQLQPDPDEHEREIAGTVEPSEQQEQQEQEEEKEQEKEEQEKEQQLGTENDIYSCEELLLPSSGSEPEELATVEEYLHYEEDDGQEKAHEKPQSDTEDGSDDNDDDE